MQFSRWGDMDDASRDAWFRFMQDAWGEDLLGGYGTLVMPPRINP